MSESTETILVHLKYISASVDALVTEAKIQNGRLRKAEMDISRLDERTTEARDAARTTGAKWGATVGGGVAAAAGYLWNHFLGK